MGTGKTAVMNHVKSFLRKRRKVQLGRTVLVWTACVFTGGVPTCRRVEHINMHTSHSFQVLLLNRGNFSNSKYGGRDVSF